MCYGPIDLRNPSTWTCINYWLNTIRCARRTNIRRVLDSVRTWLWTSIKRCWKEKKETKKESGVCYNQSPNVDSKWKRICKIGRWSPTTAHCPLPGAYWSDAEKADISTQPAWCYLQLSHHWRGRFNRLVQVLPTDELIVHFSWDRHELTL